MILLFACIGEGEPVDSVPDEADTDTDTDADTDAGNSALTGRLGESLVDTDYLGTETLYFVADEGAGEDLCRVSYTMTSTGARTDCSDCEWAFDLVLSDPVAETDVGCSDLDVDPAALDGTTVSYGYTSEYVGHGKVLFVEQDAVWTAVSFATYEAPNFDYDWESGFVEYR